MPEIKLPYGRKELLCNIPNERLAGIITGTIDKVEPECGLVEKALKNPVCSQPLHKLAEGKKNIVIIASDHTRPVPSREIIPHMLSEIRLGSPDADITLLIATGCHRAMTHDELVNKFGEEIVSRERIVIHDCTNDSELVKLGTLPSGGELIINRTAAEADLLVSEGFIEPHFFAGYSGGRKSILPGIASRVTVYANHCSKFISDINSRAGILDCNPIHKDMIYAAETAKLAFIVNVVINAKHEIIAAFAGDFNEAHIAGTRFFEKLCLSKPIYSDIVITTNNGYPLDQNIYQSVKGMTAGEATCNKGGVIIMAAECSDGSGGESFHKIFRENRSAKDILKKIEKVPQNETEADQWESQILARILSEYRVIFVSEAPDSLIEDFHMIPAHSINEALSKADAITGKAGAKITVIPEGISCIIRQ